jgi:CBS domain-containing protein
MKVGTHTVTGPVRATDATSPLSALVCRPAVCVPSDSSLHEAAQAMRDAGVSALLVDRGTGIVTERDLARALAAGCQPADPVASAVTPHPITCDPSTGVVDAAALMLNEQVRHLVVELPGGGLGVVSIRDVLAVLLQAADHRVWLTSLRVAVEAPTDIWLG